MFVLKRMANYIILHAVQQKQKKIYSKKQKNKQINYRKQISK